jgi:hypothetical protein
MKAALPYAPRDMRLGDSPHLEPASGELASMASMALTCTSA